MTQKPSREKIQNFKKRRTIVKTDYGEWDIEEYQCPFCKRWFHSSDAWGFNENAVKLHITKLAKIEVFATAIGDIRQKPHFDFYKKVTEPMPDLITRKRYWLT